MSAQLTFIRKDHSRSGDGTYWSWVCILSFEGELENRPDEKCMSEDQENAIYEICEANGCRVMSQGSGTPGTRYSDPPFIWITGKTIIVSQRGGLDV